MPTSVFAPYSAIAALDAADERFGPLEWSLPEGPSPLLHRALNEKGRTDRKAIAGASGECTVLETGLPAIAGRAIIRLELRMSLRHSLAWATAPSRTLPFENAGRCWTAAVHAFPNVTVRTPCRMRMPYFMARTAENFVATAMYPSDAMLASGSGLERLALTRCWMGVLVDEGRGGAALPLARIHRTVPVPWLVGLEAAGAHGSRILIERAILEVDLEVTANGMNEPVPNPVAADPFPPDRFEIAIERLFAETGDRMPFYIARFDRSDFVAI